jgi:hypothetical protein
VNRPRKAANGSTAPPVHTFETQDPIDALAQAILRALQPGNGRSNRCEVEAELPDRLASDGVTFDVSDLDQALTRLEDCGRIIRTQRQPFSIYPQFLVSSGSGPYGASGPGGRGMAYRGLFARGALPPESHPCSNQIWISAMPRCSGETQPIAEK